MPLEPQSNGAKEKLKALKRMKKMADGELRYDIITQQIYSTDASPFEIRPLAAFLPKTVEDVILAHQVCYQHKIPLTPRGGGSGLCGQALSDGLIIDFVTHMNEIVEFNPEEKWIRVQAGMYYGTLNEFLREHGLYLPPDPSSGDYAAMGGIIGNNGSGAHSVKYGLIGDYLEELTVVLSDGTVAVLHEWDVNSPEFKAKLEEDGTEAELYRNILHLVEREKELITTGYPDIVYNVAGYDMKVFKKDGKFNPIPIIVGSEGTLATIVEIKLRVVEFPKHVILGLFFFDELEKGGEAANIMLEHDPSAVEILGHHLIEVAKAHYAHLRENLPDDLNNILILEFDGDDEAKIEEEMKTVVKRLTKDKKLAIGCEYSTDPTVMDTYWEVRKKGTPLLYTLKGPKKIAPYLEDIAVAPKHLAEYMKRLQEILKKHGIEAAIYGHASKGLLHTRPLHDLKNIDCLQSMRRIMEDIYEVVVELGGTISAEHGDGRLRTPYLPRLLGDLYGVMRQMKCVWDPKGLMNPGNIISDKPFDFPVEDMRYGPFYSTIDLGEVLHWEGREHFDEIEQCHGCNKCTTLRYVSTMCPAFKGTRDPFAAPKSKANFMRGIISGKIPEDQMYNKVIKQMLNFCLDCKSCHYECSSEVNIPKIVLEAKAKYVERHGQSFQNQVITNYQYMAALARPVAPVANLFMKFTPARWFMDKIVGVARRRRMPPFSRQTFRKWHKKHATRAQKTGQSFSKKVAFFHGCYANFADTIVGKSLVQVLEANGYEVLVPKQKCCGVPYLANGSASAARKNAEFNVEQLVQLVNQGYEIVTTCTSCQHMLTEEYYDVLVHSNDARKVASKTYVISDFLLRLKENGELNENFGNVDFTAGYHTPCHLKSMQSIKDKSVEMLALIPGLTVERLDEGCCGIAGSWGFKSQNFNISMDIGEDLFNAMGATHLDIGVTDCPTCKLQLSQGVKDKQILHPVEIIAKSYEAGSNLST